MAIVFGVLVVVAGVKVMQIRKMMKSPWPAQVETISSAVASEEKWQDTLSAVGSVDPQSGTTLAAEIPGTVAEIKVADGSSVKKGDLLIRLDTSAEDAQLRAAEAQAEWAKVSAERLRKLRTDNTVSQSELDQSEATLKQMQANADAIRAAIDKKNIRAPFTGKLGLWLVNVGTTLDARHPLISLQSLTPLYVDFWLPQQDLALVKTGLV
ncbi:MAG TPA: efflux RND transporter periplasmic adaptor subunit, partial [Candidatus Baltobacteraceae bacterium]|nr:efflux RND transporter periplasmic adaptor subunit [Candidatus Baltobacteraceae bacterium]